ncbi:MAG TPA: hypothetical protein VFB52_04930 [Solirubrobacterales bacterium]|nr:hypothetical protein [Solirubrobacterales bacterium]
MIPPRMISLQRNHFIALIVGVCILSAGIGTAVALIAQTGPEGPAGKQGKAGPQGPKGPRGPSGEAAVEGVQAEVEELRGQVEGSAELEERVQQLEDEVSNIGGFEEELCEEDDFFC